MANSEKYADSDQLFITDPTRKNKSMMDDGWGEIIGSWLEEDLRLRRKLRRTAKAIHEQLKPLGFLAPIEQFVYTFLNGKAALRRNELPSCRSS